MASGSSASSPPSSTNLASRFSTLKVFKFSSKDKGSGPPPLPPKDVYYLRNRSLASLSPDSLSLPPNSPLSPQAHYQYARQPSPDPNQSSMSLASSAASFKSSSAEPKGRPQSRGKERALAFLKFPKRSPRSPSNKGSLVPDELDPPPPVEDENISMPWNFQHNIHVDEGFLGLPPSWSTSLAAAGFSEEEIVAIQNRRAAGARSPNSQYIFNTRPQSPSIQHPYYSAAGSPPNQVPVLTQPSPRTTSLPRQYSDASLKSGSQQGHQRPPNPFALTVAASASTTSLQSTKLTNMNNVVNLTPQRLPSSHEAPSLHHASQSSISFSSDSQHSNRSVSDRKDQIPLVPVRLATVANDMSTPPRRQFHTSNGSSSTPPPSYINFGHQRNESKSSFKRFFGSQPDTELPPSSNLPHRPRANTDASDSRSAGSSQTGSSIQPSVDPSPARNKRTAMPPRLSLHKGTDSTDFSSWAGALLSGISSGGLQENLNGPTSPQSAPPSAMPTARPHQNRSLSRDPPSKPEPSRPLPPTNLSNGTINGNRRPSEWNEPLDNAYDSVSSPHWDESPASSPLWSELESILGQTTSPEEEEHTEHEPGPYSAALAETFSPTLPFSPEEELIMAQRKKRNESRMKGESDRLPEEEDVGHLSVNGERSRDPNRDSSRSSSSTISTSTVTGLNTGTTIVRNVSIARRAGAYVIDKSKAAVGARERAREREKASTLPDIPSPPNSRPPVPLEAMHPPSPLSSHFDSEDGSASGSASSSSQSQDNPTPTTESGSSPLMYYLEPSPDPSRSSFSPGPHRFSILEPYGNTRKDIVYDIHDLRHLDEDDDEDVSVSAVQAPSPPVNRPTIVISDDVPPNNGPSTAMTPANGTPLSPFQRYRGWLSEVVAPLEEYIDESVDPRDHYLDLKEIAEGESGSVFSARLTEINAHKLRLPPLVKAKDTDDIANGRTILVAIKSVAIVPSGSPKLVDLEHELFLMRGLWHENIITLDGLYVDLLEDTLWIRMELMERSLADVIALVDRGLMLQDRMMARFASDVLKALEYLQKHNVAHRDVRSDNLLLNKHGVLRLTDFANAVQVSPQSPMCSDPAGVPFWQAPEVRSPPYNPLKIDVWSLGATVWEMAETEPPFADTQQWAERWPPLSKPENYSPAFHDFLYRCSEPAASRPSASELLKSHFINNACGRPVIVQLLSQCISIENFSQEGNVSAGSESE